MPPPIRRADRRDEAPTYTLPSRVARALRPSQNRSGIPERITLGSGAPPFADEVREEQSKVIVNLPANGTVLAVTLRRAWSFVGFAVDPGNTGVGGLNAQIKVITRGVQGFFPVVVVTPGQPKAFAAQIVGARAELWITNNTAVAVAGLKCTIWGMSDT